MGPTTTIYRRKGGLVLQVCPLVPFPNIVLTVVAERSAPSAKADIPQGPLMKYNKGTSESNVKPRARKSLGAANANATARKKPKPASKPNRRRLQVVLT